MSRFSKALFCGLLLVFSCLSAQDTKVFYLQKISAFLDGLTTLEADFLQFDENGNVIRGHIWLKKPSLMKMRTPAYVIILKDDKVAYYDLGLKEKTVTSAYSSPLSFLLQKRADLRSHLNVLSAQESGDVLSITVCKKDPEADGAITLIFTKDTFRLCGWKLHTNRAQPEASRTISVMLSDQKINQGIPRAEFESVN
jgi:outer membrane lipoprotein-sorting protein